MSDTIPADFTAQQDVTLDAIGHFDALVRKGGYVTRSEWYGIQILKELRRALGGDKAPPTLKVKDEL